MWSIFKKKKAKKEFIFEYKWHNLRFNTITFGKDRESAIENFKLENTFTHILSIKEV